MYIYKRICTCMCNVSHIYLIYTCIVTDTIHILRVYLYVYLSEWWMTPQWYTFVIVYVSKSQKSYWDIQLVIIIKVNVISVDFKFLRFVQSTLKCWSWLITSTLIFKSDRLRFRTWTSVISQELPWLWKA